MSSSRFLRVPNLFMFVFKQNLIDKNPKVTIVKKAAYFFLRLALNSNFAARKIGSEVNTHTHLIAVILPQKNITKLETRSVYWINSRQFFKRISPAAFIIIRITRVRLPNFSCYAVNIILSTIFSATLSISFRIFSNSSGSTISVPS